MRLGAASLLLAPAAGAGPTVPASVRQTIVRSYPGMAYLPSRLPSGYRYGRWSHSKQVGYFEYQIDFLHGSTSEVSFQVIRRPCPTAPSWPAEGTVRLNGHVISWSRTTGGVYAWRCIEDHGKPFVIFGTNAPVRRAAFVVAYAAPVR